MAKKTTKKQLSPLQEQASKGGKARAKAMTPKQRSENARRAVEARWAKAGKPTMLRATHGSLEHPLVIGDIELPCYVLEDGTRVFSQRGLQSGLAMGVRGGALRMAKFADDIALNSSKHQGLVARFKSPINFVSPTGHALGYEATILVDLCDAILDARSEKELKPGLAVVAERCEILVRAFAKVGIIALVDEATGYQYERARTALEDLLQEFLSDELRAWVKTFPNAYFKQLCRLKNIPMRPDMRFPRYFGRITANIVYKRLHPGLLNELQSRSPVNTKGNRPHKLFQWLSEGLGHPQLLQHLGAVIGLMKISPDYETFKKHLDVVAPVSTNDPAQLRLPTMED
ncbi:MAG: P63C domain-containing protein [Planctomycetes bacterium]|nr:P63C domain-containing protein [Planctomycetota bacterium]